MQMPPSPYRTWCITVIYHTRREGFKLCGWIEIAELRLQTASVPVPAVCGQETDTVVVASKSGWSIESFRMELHYTGRGSSAGSTMRFLLVQYKIAYCTENHAYYPSRSTVRCHVLFIGSGAVSLRCWTVCGGREDSAKSSIYNLYCGIWYKGLRRGRNGIWTRSLCKPHSTAFVNYSTVLYRTAHHMQ